MKLFTPLSNITSRPEGSVIARNAVTKQSVASLRAEGHPRIASSACGLLAMTVLGLSATSTRALEFPKYEKVTKGNTTVLVMKQDRVPLVAIRVTIDFSQAGSDYDPSRAALYLHAIKHGSVNYRGETWLATLDEAGAELGEETDAFSISLTTEVRKEDAEKVLRLLLDGMLNPELDAAKVGQEKDRLISEIESAGDQPQTLAGRAVELAYFGASHPYGTELTPARLRSVANPNEFSISGNHRSGFACALSNSRLTVTLVGDVTLSTDVIFAAAEPAGINARHPLWLDQGPATTSPASAPCSPAAPSRTAVLQAIKSPRVILIDLPDAQQTQVRLMVPGPSDIYSPLHLANIPFGATFTSRLVRKLRTELGLTYSIGARLEQRPLASTYAISSFTKAASTGEFLKVLFAEIGRARREGLTAEELAKGKALLLGEGPMRWERYSGLAQLLEHNTLDGRPDDYPLTSITRAQTVRLKDANAALAAALPDKNFVLVLAGPASRIRPIAAQYGRVERWTKRQVIDPK